MPKPVLSDSLFNADDVATAVLAEANLQIANSDLGVTDITNKFTYASGVSTWFSNPKAYHFNGFVYINMALKKSSGTIADSTPAMTINDSTYCPNTDQVICTANLNAQGEGAEIVWARTNGEITLVNVMNSNTTPHYIVIAGMFHTGV